MAKSGTTSSENSNSTLAGQASAGRPQHITATRTGPAAAPAPTPTAADFDARQQSLGTTRRSGPPLPDTSDGTGPAAMALEAAAEQEGATEVNEPRKKTK